MILILMIATYHWCLTLCIAFIRCNTLISCFFCFQYYRVLKRKNVRMIFFCNLFFDSFWLFYSRNPVFIHSGIWHYKWRHTDKLCIRLLCNFFHNGFISGFKLLFFQTLSSIHHNSDVIASYQNAYDIRSF